MCVTWLIYVCAMTHSYVWHDSFICVTWLIHMCYMSNISTHSCVTYQLMCVSQHINSCVWVMSNISTHSHINESCHTYESTHSHINESCHTYESTHSHINESCHTYQLMCVTWVMSHTHINSCVWHDSFMCVWRDSFICHINSFICVWHDSFMCVWRDSFIRMRRDLNVSCHTWMSHVTHVNESHHK